LSTGLCKIILLCYYSEAIAGTNIKSNEVFNFFEIKAKSADNSVRKWPIQDYIQIISLLVNPYPIKKYPKN